HNARGDRGAGQAGACRRIDRAAILCESCVLQMLKEAVPSTAKAAFLGMRGGWEGSSGQVLRKPATAWEFPWFGCHSLGMEMFVINAGSEREIDTAFATMDQHGAGALL